MHVIQRKHFSGSPRKSKAFGIILVMISQKYIKNCFLCNGQLRTSGSKDVVITKTCLFRTTCVVIYIYTSCQCVLYKKLSWGWWFEFVDQRKVNSFYLISVFPLTKNVHQMKRVNQHSKACQFYDHLERAT